MNRLVDEVGSVLNGVTFLIFGAILLGPALGQLSWDLAVYAVLSLTVVRMVPGGDRDAGNPDASGHCWVPGLVRPSRARLDRLRRDRPRGIPLPHGQTILLAIYLTVGLSGSSSTGHRGAAGQLVWALVRGSAP